MAIITPSSAFTTAQDIADRLGRTFTDTETTQVAALIADATAQIQDFTRQTILPVAGDTMTRESPDGPWLELPQRPVTVVTSVAVNGNTITDYSKIGDRLYRVYGWRWPSVDTIPPLAIYGLKSTVTVVYSHGYDPVPEPVAAVCRRMVMRALASGVSGLASEKIDDYQYQAAEPGAGVILTPADEKQLRRYRRPARSISLGSGAPGFYG